MTEWGIVSRREPDELHRGPMSLEDAQEWLRDWKEMGGREDAFLLARREIEPWRPTT